MRRTNMFGHEICYTTRRYGRNTVFYWLNAIDGKEPGTDPFPDRESFLDYIKNYK